MRYRLLCIDLDGTLLDDGKQIPEQTVKAIQKASDRGVKIALVTGRMPAATDFIAERLKVPCILACNAGTYILKGEQCISSEYLSCNTMEKIYDTIMKYRVPLWIFRHRQWMVTGMDDIVQYEIDLVHYIPEIVELHELSEKWRMEQTGPNKVLVGANSLIIGQLYEELRNKKFEDVDMALSSENYLEIFPKGMNKGKALHLICKSEGIREEETIAFGDQELDIPMIEAAGVGIAMGNAIEELKAKADFITKTNNEAGIAYALEQYLD